MPRTLTYSLKSTDFDPFYKIHKIRYASALAILHSLRLTSGLKNFVQLKRVVNGYYKKIIIIIIKRTLLVVERIAARRLTSERPGHWEQTKRLLT